jgi:uncharacterized protein (DUF3820 family)
MDNKKFIMPWGRYQGEYLCDLPTSYLEWLETNIDNEKIIKLVEIELNDREKKEKYDGGHSD